ncbi:hypothetical protein CspHIS471_0410000 [Cutaneotrichosporon sp. HIS471]|nr:hypothetical protein CspHIS471_0410000 [Cutaneotrichosporon sp. HIS471]
MTNDDQDNQQAPATDAMPGIVVSKFQDCRVFEVDEKSLGSSFAVAANAEVVRVPSVDLALLKPLPHTVVLKTPCCPNPNEPRDWLAGFNLPGPPIPDGPKRLVVNVSYLCSNQIFASTVESQVPIDIPPSVEDTLTTDTAKPFTAPIPKLRDKQFVLFIEVPQPENDISTLDRIAKMYARAVEKQYNPKLKLTVVGLDEFNESRAQDAQDDVIFGPKLARLPFGKIGWPVTHPQRLPLLEALVGEAKLSKMVMHKCVG